MSSGGSSVSIDERRHFLQALQRMLRPIIRLMIRNGIRYDEFADVARSAYVGTAIRYGAEKKTELTEEQLAWMTGVSRLQIDHYVHQDSLQVARTPRRPTVAAAVLHKWYTDARYQSDDGSPLEVGLDSAAAGTTFGSLVAEVAPDADPSVILEELINAKAVVYSSERRIRALTRCVIHQADTVASIDYFANTLIRLIETHEHNFEPENSEKKRLDRTVFPDRRLPVHLLPEFHAFARERANQLLSDLDDWLDRLSDASVRDSDNLAETGLHLFLYVDEPIDSRALSSLIKARRGGADANWQGKTTP